ncbi:hypothetical protein ACTS95_08040 [Empedobacter brevis]
MDKQFLNKHQLEERVKVLNDWYKQNPEHPMRGSVKNEAMYFIRKKNELLESTSTEIEVNPITQIYQQIGKLL